MSGSVREIEEMTGNEVSIDDFMGAVTEAQAYKNHISVDIVSMRDHSNFITTVHGIDPDNIWYIDKIGCIQVIGSNTSLTVPDADCIYMMDVTPPDKDWYGMTTQYSFWIDDLCVAFLFNYDETVVGY